MSEISDHHNGYRLKEAFDSVMTINGTEKWNMQWYDMPYQSKVHP